MKLLDATVIVIPEMSWKLILSMFRNLLFASSRQPAARRIVNAASISVERLTKNVRSAVKSQEMRCKLTLSKSSKDLSLHTANSHQMAAELTESVVLVSVPKLTRNARDLVRSQRHPKKAYNVTIRVELSDHALRMTRFIVFKGLHIIATDGRGRHTFTSIHRNVKYKLRYMSIAA